MAANIGGVAIDLGMNSAAFQRDVAAATNALKAEATKMRIAMRNIERAANSVERQFSQLKSGALALGGALAVREFGRFAKQAIDSASAIHDTAAAVGLSTQALQEFQIAAGLSGVGMEKFDASLARFVRNLGEARQGSGTLVAALKDTDQAFLKQIQTAGTTEQALNLIFQRMADIKDPATRAAFAVAAFGREGIKMTGIVRDGVGGLIDMRKEARELGLTLEDGLIKKAEALGDRMDMLRKAFQTGFERSIISQFADEFQLTKDNIEAARDAGQEFGRVVGIAMKAAAEAAEFVGRNMREIVAALAAFAAFKAAAMFAILAGAVVKFGAALRTAVAAQGLLNIAMAANPALRLAAALTALAVAFDALGPASDRAQALAADLKNLDARIAELQQRKDINLPLFGSAEKNEAELQRLLAQRARVAAMLEQLRSTMGATSAPTEEPGISSIPLRTKDQEAFNAQIDRTIAALRDETAWIGQSTIEYAAHKAMMDASNKAQADSLTLSKDRALALYDLTKANLAAQAAEQTRGDMLKRLSDEAIADAQAVTDIKKAMETTRPSLSSDLNREIEDLKKLTEAANQGSKAYETQVALLEIRNRLMAANVPYGEAEVESYRKLAESVGEWQDKLNESKDRLDDLKDASRDFGHVIGTAFEDAVLEGGKLSDVLRALYEDINRIILRLTITKPIENELTKWLSPTGSSGGSGGGGGGDWLSSLFGLGGGSGGMSGAMGPSATMGSGSGSIGFYEGMGWMGFASGTDNAPAGMAWVGEEGPELVRFRGGETVVPHDESMRMAGGAQITQHVYVQGRIDDRSLTHMERASAKGASRGGRR